MIRIIFYLVVVLVGFLYFYVISHSPQRKWWEDMLALLSVVFIYAVFILNFYIDDRIGNILFIASTLLLGLFFYKGMGNAFKKIKR